MIELITDLILLKMKKNASKLLSIIQENIDTKYIEFHQFSLLLYQVLKLINSSYNDEKSRKNIATYWEYQ